MKRPGSRKVERDGANYNSNFTKASIVSYGRIVCERESNVPQASRKENRERGNGCRDEMKLLRREYTDHTDPERVGCGRGRMHLYYH